ncbi:MAG: HAD-IIA family hydrolase [Armatimonadota bacterium]|nr:HAD-IIA family hydrolase [Armatimonadota bacterium]
MNHGIPSSIPRLWILDLDGVIYRGSELQPHAREFVQHVRSRGDIVRFLTNKAAHAREEYAELLTSFGIPTSPNEVMTSGYATALYLAQSGAAGKTVYRIGESGIDRELSAFGFRVIRDGEAPNAQIDYVVVGMDRQFNYDKLARAQKAILEGAKFIATNEDPTLPVENGGLLPGAGCMVAAVRIATSTEPFVVGKPHTYALEKLLESTGVSVEQTVVIGDRLDTDILAGNRIGATTVLVLTGVTTREEAEKASEELRPDLIIETLGDLLECT